MKKCRSIKFLSRMIPLIIFTVFIGFAASKLISQALAAEPAKPAAKPTAKPAEAPPAKPAEPTKPAEKVSPVLDPKDPKSVLYLDTKGKLAGTGDPAKSGRSNDQRGTLSSALIQTGDRLTGLSTSCPFSSPTRDQCLFRCPSATCGGR